MTKKLLSGVLAIVVAALVGISTGVSAASPLWSVAVHIEYPDGFVYDHAFATGVPTSELPSILQECARGHMGGSGVRYLLLSHP